MGMKYIFVGDVHGDVELVRNVLNFANKRQVVFLGDFLDSFTFSKKDQIDSLLLAIDAVRSGTATILHANHEMSYLDSRMRCGGWNTLMETHILPIKTELTKMMTPAIFLSKKPTLITHAGVSRQLWNHLNLEIKSLPQLLNEASKDLGSWFYWAGRARGGADPYGGPLWCDWNTEFTPVPGLIQILGHTCTFGTPLRFQQRFISKVRYSDNYDFNIDCLQEVPEILEYDEDAGHMTVCRVDNDGISQVSVSILLP
jgi:hypothetical protein